MDRVATLASRLLGARRTGRRIALPAQDEAPQSLAEGYRVQAAVTAGLGAMIGGYKVGLAPDGVATFAPIHRSDIVANASAYSTKPFDRVGVELEFAFRFARQVPASASPSAVLDAVDAVYVAIELCETRYVTHENVPRFSHLADHLFNRGLALGSELRFDRGADFRSMASRWIIDGKPVLEKKASHPSGDALAPLAMLPRILSEQGRAIEPGDLVITGSLNGLTWAPVGTKVEGRIDGFGSVELTIAA